MLASFGNACRKYGPWHVTAIKYRSIPLGSQNRFLSTTRNSHIDFQLDNKSGIGLMELKKSPANTLSVEFMTEISIKLEKMEDIRDCRGLILASGIKDIFSGGIELQELYNPKEERLRQLWRLLQDIWLRLYSTRLATVAAVNGHAPAGGCLLALSCDHRIMADGPGLIGFSGSKFGITPPKWILSVLLDTIGHRESAKAIATGRMFSASEALHIGLMDEVVTPAQLITASRAHLTKLLGIPDIARQLSKNNIRGPLYSQLLVTRQMDMDVMVDYLLQDDVQNLIGSHLEKLKSKNQQ